MILIEIKKDIKQNVHYNKEKKLVNLFLLDLGAHALSNIKWIRNVLFYI